MSAKRSNSQGGKRHHAPSPKLRQAQREGLENLKKLRTQLGTTELARRMGIPAPSLRRMLSKGKSGGLPKTWASITRVQTKITVSRMRPESRKRMKLHNEIKRVIDSGTLDIEYGLIAKVFDMPAREIYSMGRSPEQYGIAV